MALPTITQRPVKELVSGVYAYFVSRWNALHNPVVYHIANDKWPVSGAGAQAITGQADDNGNVEFTIAAHPYTTLEWVTIASSGIADYNGTWQIIAITGGSITLDLAYQVGAIGGAITATLYYQNYHMLIQVWAGVPAGHVLNAEDPIVLVATIPGRPDDSNITKVDVSAVAKDHISLVNDLGLVDNDINLWAGIYIKFAESYDIPSGSEVIQFISSYTDDVNELIYGTQSKMPFQNTYGGNMGTLVLNEGDEEKKFLTKFSDPILWPDRYFDLSVIVDKLLVDSIQDSLFLMYSEYDNNQDLLYANKIEAGAEAGNIYNLNNPTTAIGQTFTLDDFSHVRAFAIKINQIIGAPIKSYDLVLAMVYSHHTVRFTIDTLANVDIVEGWNIYEFDFNLGPGEYAFYLDPQAGGTLDGGNYYKVEIDNGAPYVNGFGLLRVGAWATQAWDLTSYVALDISGDINDLDEGIYRLQINNLIFSIPTNHILIYIRYSKYVVRNPGFDSALAPWTNIPFGGGAAWVWNAPGEAKCTDGVKFTSDMLAQVTTLESGRRYYWQFEVDRVGTNFIDIEMDGWDGGWNLIDSFRVAFAGIYSGTFVAGSDYTMFGFFVNDITLAPIDIEFDSFFVWEIVDIAQEQKVIINSKCEKQSIYLTWINNLGGWEYWNFTAEKEYGVDIEDSSEFDANIFNDWDDNFINGETVTALETVRARDTRTVRSQFLTQTQVDAIANIKTSIRVQQIRDDGTKITVLIDKKSFKIREDQQKLYTIEFSLRYTDLIPVQDA